MQQELSYYFDFNTSSLVGVPSNARCNDLCCVKSNVYIAQQYYFEKLRDDSLKEHKGEIIVVTYTGEYSFYPTFEEAWDGRESNKNIYVDVVGDEFAVSVMDSV